MAEEQAVSQNTVNTVLGPVAAEELGVVSVHERLLSVLPGAEYAYDLRIDRAEVFEVLAAKLTEFKRAGGDTIVDSIGMFHGRDLPLLEALARSTGVHIVASTGLGPEGLLGGYFLTPQTNPPTPWPAEKFSELFTKEVTEGMAVPRVERRSAAGIVTVTVTTDGMTATDKSLVRGSARTALATGVPASIRFGAEAVHDLEVALEEQLDADRVVIGGLDRRAAVGARAPLAVASRGAYVAIDHVGSTDDLHISDNQRVAVIAELIAAGHADRILISSDATGYAVGHSVGDLPYDHLLSDFVPRLRAAGVDEPDVQRVLIENPRNLLTVR